MNKKILILAALLFAVFIGLAAFFINDSSPTYDEHTHLTAGYSYWKTGKIILNMKDHPPLVKKLAAVPLLFMNLSFPVNSAYYQTGRQWEFADMFIYWNNMSAEKIVNAGRYMIVFLGICAGVVVLLFSYKMYGIYAAVFSLFLFVLNPNIIANSSLVTTDIGVTFGYIASIFTLYLFTRKPSSLLSLLAGLAVGVCIMSKFSGIFILVVYPCVLGYLFVKKKLANLTFGRILIYFLLFAVGVYIVAAFSYGFDSINLYFNGLKRLFTLTNSGFSSFLCGKYSTTGWYQYFVVAFILKNPIIFILAVIVLMGFFIRDIIKNKTIFTDEFLFLIFPAALFFVSASASKFQIGIRHILPVFPLLMIWCGSLIKPPLKKSLLIVVPCVLLYAISTLSAFPYFLSYFNVIAGGEKNGYHCLVDSNYDWGQSLKSLGRYLKSRGISNIYFSYFGTADPHNYGINYIPIGFVSTLERTGDVLDMTKEKTRLFAISVTNLMANYYKDKDTFKYFRESKPTAVIDHTIFVFDITNDRTANEYLRELFSGNEDYVKMQDKILNSLVE